MGRDPDDSSRACTPALWPAKPQGAARATVGWPPIRENSVRRTVLDRKPPEVDAASAGIGSESLKHQIGRRTNNDIRLTHRIKLERAVRNCGAR
jgi:hypothetical protein